MSHYTFTLSLEVYKWIVVDQLIPNKGTQVFIKVKSTILKGSICKKILAKANLLCNF